MDVDRDSGIAKCGKLKHAMFLQGGSIKEARDEAAAKMLQTKSGKWTPFISARTPVAAVSYQRT
jgi:hypothetical protein